METFSPIVINSKKAQDHYNDIKSQHNDIVRGIQDQLLKVSAINSEKQAANMAETERKESMKMESDKVRMDNEVRILDAKNKSRELDIKEQALTL